MSQLKLCRNCVTCPPNAWGNTVIYGDTPTHVDVAEVVESKVRRWGLMCVSRRERIQFPRVLLQPLGHLWDRAIQLADRGRSAGVTVPLTDLLIFACAKLNGLDVAHHDSHFDELAKLDA